MILLSHTRDRQRHVRPQTRTCLPGESLIACVPKYWLINNRNLGVSTASAPTREASGRFNACTKSWSLPDYATHCYSFVPDVFRQADDERRFTVNGLDIVVREYEHPDYQLHRVFACIKVNELRDVFAHIRFYTKVSAIAAYRNIFDGIIASVRVQRND